MTSIETFFTGTTPVHLSNSGSSSSGNSTSPSPNLSLLTRKVSVKGAKSYSLEGVLQNTYLPPFALSDFSKFLKAENAVEKLEFLQLIRDYKKLVAALLPSTDMSTTVPVIANVQSQKRASNKNKQDVIYESAATAAVAKENKSNYTLPVKPANYSDETYQKLIGAAKASSKKIVETYLAANSPKDVMVPEQIRSSVLASVEAGEIHPKIFQESEDFVFKMLNQGSFSRFVRQAVRASASVLEAPKYTINQIVLDEIPFPFSRAGTPTATHSVDFRDYLKAFQEEDELAFLVEVLDFQKAAVRFHPIPMATVQLRGRSESSASSAPPSPGGVISLPSPLPFAESLSSSRKSGFLAAGGNGSFSSDFSPSPMQPADLGESQYNEAIASLKKRIRTMADTYIRADSPKQMNLPASLRKYLLTHIDSDSCHQDLLNQPYEHIANELRLNRLPSFLKAKFEVARLEAILEASIPKYTITQLLNNEIASPYSRNDFLRFVKQDVCEENLEFLIAFSEYEKLAKVIYPTATPKNPSEEEYDIEDDNTRPALMEAAVLVPPARPPAYTEAQFAQLQTTVKTMAADIKTRFIAKGAARELRLPDAIRNPLLERLDTKLINPIIFHGAKRHISEVVQTNSLNKFLRKTYEDRLNGGIVLKLSKGIKSKVDSLFLDELPAPYSYHSFADFCMSQDCSEGVEFTKQVMTYVKAAIPLYVDNADTTDSHFAEPKKPADMSQAAFAALVAKLENDWAAIYETYLLPSSKKAVKLPEAIAAALLKNYESKIRHPNVFTRAYDFFSANLEINVWDVYSKYTDPRSTAKKDEDSSAVTIRQIAMNEAPAPYTYQAYMNYLRTQMCEECLEFLQACYKYQAKAFPLYSSPVIKTKKSAPFNEWIIPAPLRPAEMSEKEFQSQVYAVRQTLNSIVETFIRPESPREVNLPVTSRKPFLKLYDEGTQHPDLLSELIEHISSMLRLNNLSKFIKLANETNTAEGGKTSQDKYTIKQVVLNLLPPPHSVKDFMKFLEAEHAEETLEFMLAVISYHSLSTAYYPVNLPLAASPIKSSPAGGLSRGMTITVPPTTPVPPTLPAGQTTSQMAAAVKTMKEQCNEMLETFILPGSPKEINITSVQRKVLMNELKNETFHPEIWKPTFEHVANMLRTNLLAKFLKSEGGGRSSTVRK
ncbi:hypothetical protein HDV03_002956 [Kappamyces sp. JEL0829]|nr:hypothetical protein HDV03_002956 [Kappamyces sp. JEL0829]